MAAHGGEAGTHPPGRRRWGRPNLALVALGVFRRTWTLHLYCSIVPHDRAVDSLRGGGTERQTSRSASHPRPAKRLTKKTHCDIIIFEVEI